MQFSAQEDLDAPAAALFAAISDFSTLEDLARRRRVDLRRLDHLEKAGKGLSWDLRFKLRGKKREVLLDLVDWRPPESYRVAGGSRAFDLVGELTVIPLSPLRSRLAIKIVVKPVTLAAKLMVQGARLTKRRLDRRFAARFSALAAEAEVRAARYKS